MCNIHLLHIFFIEIVIFTCSNNEILGWCTRFFGRNFMKYHGTNWYGVVWWCMAYYYTVGHGWCPIFSLISRSTQIRPWSLPLSTDPLHLYLCSSNLVAQLYISNFCVMNFWHQVQKSRKALRDVFHQHQTLF